MSKIPNEVATWKIGGKTGNLTSNEHYVHDKGLNLRCSANKNKYLIWGKQTLGINLAWNDKAQNKYHFHLPDKKEREILTGEPFAIGIGSLADDPYLKYAHRNAGIDLSWTGEPAYEWVIYGPKGEKGKPIPMNSVLAIINKKADSGKGDFLIYFDQVVPGTADVGWTTSPGWGDYFKKAAGIVWDKALSMAGL